MAACMQRSKSIVRAMSSCALSAVLCVALVPGAAFASDVATDESAVTPAVTFDNVSGYDDIAADMANMAVADAETITVTCSLIASSDDDGETGAYDTLRDLTDYTFTGVFAFSVEVDGKTVTGDFGSFDISFPIGSAYDGEEIIVHARHNSGSFSRDEVEVASGMATVTCSEGEIMYSLDVDESLAVPETAVSMSSATVTLTSTSYTYSGSAKKPGVIVTVGDKTLTKDKHYTVSYKNNTAIGKATVKVTGVSEKGYTGSKSTSFTIKPGKVTLKSTTKSMAKKKITVRWSKVKGGVKYQVAYKKKGASAWKRRNVNSTTCKKVLTKLSSKKNYCVKVRAYKKVNGTTYKGSWSSVKTVKVK